MTYAELFAGIGGWSVGLQPCGWELKWQCECDPFCCAVLRARFGVPIAPDIKQIAGWIDQHPELAQVDAIVGSPPCPPFSVAGKKLGTSDARHLYPAFLESVRLLRPRYVLMEQVAGLLYDRRAFGEYIGGLESIGYCVLWHSIPACAVGAPHQRDRVWVVAHDSGDGFGRGAFATGRQAGTKPEGHREEFLANSECGRRWEQLRTDSKWESLSEAVREKGASRIRSGGEDVPNPACDLRSASRHDGPKTLDGCSPSVPNGIEQRLEGFQQAGAASGSAHGPRHVSDRSWWATEPDVGRVANGVPNRVDRLRSLGNAIVPQIPFIIGQAINLIETTKDK